MKAIPTKPLHPCKRPGCRVLTNNTYCPDHQPKREDCRQTAAQRGYTYKWHKASRHYLSGHPWCCYCQEAGNPPAPATEVDHFIPHKGDKKLFWDESNWRPACHSCHSKKTAREDGGFGNTSPHPKRK